MSNKVEYFDSNIGVPIKNPPLYKTYLSRLLLPLLALISREKAVKLGLVPLDDERVIQALNYAKGRALDIGCGANHFIKSYGNGTGVDVYPWKGVDVVVKDTASLPFENDEFDTVSFIACLNHIPNRIEVLEEADRVLAKNGRIIVTMIPPKWGKFIHWIRFRNDPDHQDRDIDHDHELLGMDPAQVKEMLKNTGYSNVTRKRFVFGINSIYVAKK